MGSKRTGSKDTTCPEISSKDLIEMFTLPAKSHAKAAELMSVFSVDSQDIYEAWKAYSSLREAGLTPKLTIRQLVRRANQTFTPEIRDYLTALMLETLTADIIRMVRCG